MPEISEPAVHNISQEPESEEPETAEAPAAEEETETSQPLPMTDATIRLDDISQIEAVPFHEELSREEPVTGEPAQEPQTVPEAEPEEEPTEPVIPPPIVFRPRSRLRELKKQLVAGPEKRYYELSEQGLGMAFAVGDYGVASVRRLPRTRSQPRASRSSRLRRKRRHLLPAP